MIPDKVQLSDAPMVFDNTLGPRFCVPVHQALTAGLGGCMEFRKTNTNDVEIDMSVKTNGDDDGSASDILDGTVVKMESKVSTREQECSELEEAWTTPLSPLYLSGSSSADDLVQNNNHQDGTTISTIENTLDTSNGLAIYFHSNVVSSLPDGNLDMPTPMVLLHKVAPEKVHRSRSMSVLIDEQIAERIGHTYRDISYAHSSDEEEINTKEMAAARAAEDLTEDPNKTIDFPMTLCRRSLQKGRHDDDSAETRDATSFDQFDNMVGIKDAAPREGSRSRIRSKISLDPKQSQLTKEFAEVPGSDDRYALVHSLTMNTLLEDDTQLLKALDNAKRNEHETVDTSICERSTTTVDPNNNIEKSSPQRGLLDDFITLTHDSDVGYGNLETETSVSDNLEDSGISTSQNSQGSPNAFIFTGPDVISDLDEDDVFLESSKKAEKVGQAHESQHSDLDQGKPVDSKTCDSKSREDNRPQTLTHTEATSVTSEVSRVGEWNSIKAPPYDTKVQKKRQRQPKKCYNSRQRKARREHRARVDLFWSKRADRCFSCAFNEVLRDRKSCEVNMKHAMTQTSRYFSAQRYTSRPMLCIHGLADCLYCEEIERGNSRSKSIHGSASSTYDTPPCKKVYARGAWERPRLSMAKFQAEILVKSIEQRRKHKMVPTGLDADDSDSFKNTIQENSSSGCKKDEAGGLAEKKGCYVCSCPCIAVSSEERQVNGRPRKHPTPPTILHSLVGSLEDRKRDTTPSDHAVPLPALQNQPTKTSSTKMASESDMSNEDRSAKSFEAKTSLQTRTSGLEGNDGHVAYCVERKHPKVALLPDHNTFPKSTQDVPSSRPSKVQVLEILDAFSEILRPLSPLPTETTFYEVQKDYCEDSGYMEFPLFKLLTEKTISPDQSVCSPVNGQAFKPGISSCLSPMLQSAQSHICVLSNGDHASENRSFVCSIANTENISSQDSNPSMEMSEVKMDKRRNTTYDTTLLNESTMLNESKSRSCIRLSGVTGTTGSSTKSTLLVGKGRKRKYLLSSHATRSLLSAGGAFFDQDSGRSLNCNKNNCHKTGDEEDSDGESGADEEDFCDMDVICDMVHSPILLDALNRVCDMRGFATDVSDEANDGCSSILHDDVSRPLSHSCSSTLDTETSEEEALETMSGDEIATIIVNALESFIEAGSAEAPLSTKAGYIEVSQEMPGTSNAPCESFSCDKRCESLQNIMLTTEPHTVRNIGHALPTFDLSQAKDELGNAHNCETAAQGYVQNDCIRTQTTTSADVSLSHFVDDLANEKEKEFEDGQSTHGNPGQNARSVVCNLHCIVSDPAKGYLDMNESSFDAFEILDMEDVNPTDKVGVLKQKQSNDTLECSNFLCTHVAQHNSFEESTRHPVQTASKSSSSSVLSPQPQATCRWRNVKNLSESFETLKYVDLEPVVMKDKNVDATEESDASENDDEDASSSFSANCLGGMKDLRRGQKTLGLTHSKEGEAQFALASPNRPGAKPLRCSSLWADGNSSCAGGSQGNEIERCLRLSPSYHRRQELKSRCKEGGVNYSASIRRRLLDQAKSSDETDAPDFPVRARSLVFVDKNEATRRPLTRSSSRRVKPSIRKKRLVDKSITNSPSTRSQKKKLCMSKEPRKQRPTTINSQETKSESVPIKAERSEFSKQLQSLCPMFLKKKATTTPATNVHKITMKYKSPLTLARQRKKTVLRSAKYGQSSRSCGDGVTHLDRNNNAPLPKSKSTKGSDSKPSRKEPNTPNPNAKATDNEATKESRRQSCSKGASGNNKNKGGGEEVSDTSEAQSEIIKRTEQVQNRLMKSHHRHYSAPDPNRFYVPMHQGNIVEADSSSSTSSEKRTTHKSASEPLLATARSPNKTKSRLTSSNGYVGSFSSVSDSSELSETDMSSLHIEPGSSLHRFVSRLDSEYGERLATKHNTGREQLRNMCRQYFEYNGLKRMDVPSDQATIDKFKSNISHFKTIGKRLLDEENSKGSSKIGTRTSPKTETTSLSPTEATDLASINKLLQNREQSSSESSHVSGSLCSAGVDGDSERNDSVSIEANENTGIETSVPLQGASYLLTDDAKQTGQISQTGDETTKLSQVEVDQSKKSTPGKGPQPPRVATTIVQNTKAASKLASFKAETRNLRSWINKKLSEEEQKASSSATGKDTGDTSENKSKEALRRSKSNQAASNLASLKAQFDDLVTASRYLSEDPHIPTPGNEESSSSSESSLKLPPLASGAQKQKGTLGRARADMKSLTKDLSGPSSSTMTSGWSFADGQPSNPDKTNREGASTSSDFRLPSINLHGNVGRKRDLVQNAAHKEQAAERAPSKDCINNSKATPGEGESNPKCSSSSPNIVLSDLEKQMIKNLSLPPGFENLLDVYDVSSESVITESLQEGKTTALQGDPDLSNRQCVRPDDEDSANITQYATHNDQSVCEDLLVPEDGSDDTPTFFSRESLIEKQLKDKLIDPGNEGEAQSPLPDHNLVSANHVESRKFENVTRPEEEKAVDASFRKRTTTIRRNKVHRDIFEAESVESGSHEASSQLYEVESLFDLKQEADKKFRHEFGDVSFLMERICLEAPLRATPSPTGLIPSHTSEPAESPHTSYTTEANDDSIPVRDALTKDKKLPFGGDKREMDDELKETEQKTEEDQMMNGKITEPLMNTCSNGDTKAIDGGENVTGNADCGSSIGGILQMMALTGRQSSELGNAFPRRKAQPGLHGISWLDHFRICVSLSPIPEMDEAEEENCEPQ